MRSEKIPGRWQGNHSPRLEHGKGGVVGVASQPKRRSVRTETIDSHRKEGLPRSERFVNEAAAPPLLVEEKLTQEALNSRTGSSSGSTIRKTSREKTGSVDEKPDSPGRSSSISKGSIREKGSRKGKGKKEEEKPKEEEVEPVIPKIIEEVPVKAIWLPPVDHLLVDYIAEVSKTILPLSTTKEQVVALAQFVADKMGGPIEKDKLHEFSWELHISEVEFELQCNVVPVGKINKGTFYHRALLFKTLADRIGIACSLVRGEYNRAWNEVKLVDDSPLGIPGLLLPPRVFIVDLMYQPGNLMKEGSPEADRYRRI